jgi:hypothetical protein
LRNSQIKLNSSAKIYVPSNLLPLFQSGWTEFTNKFVAI